MRLGLLYRHRKLPLEVAICHQIVNPSISLKIAVRDLHRKQREDVEIVRLTISLKLNVFQLLCDQSYVFLILFTSCSPSLMLQEQSQCIDFM